MCKFALLTAATAFSLVACLPDDKRAEGGYSDVIGSGGKSSSGGASSSSGGEATDASFGAGGSDPATPLFGGDATFMPVPGVPESGAAADAGECRKIVAIIRDFTPDHPDFERALPSTNG